MLLLNEDQNNKKYWDEYIKRLEENYKKTTDYLNNNSIQINKFISNNRIKIIRTSIAKTKWNTFSYKEKRILRGSNIDLKNKQITYDNINKIDPSILDNANDLSKFILSKFSIKIEGTDWKQEFRDYLRESTEKVTITGKELDDFKNNFALKICTDRKIPERIKNNNYEIINMAKKLKSENSKIDEVDSKKTNPNNDSINKSESYDPLNSLYEDLIDLSEATYTDNFDEKVNAYSNYRMYIETLQSLIGIYSDCYFQCLEECIRVCKHALK